ncbi:MAG: aldehyde oxidase, partial [Caldiserica bacterium CG_4_8_14_3_um_filter_35_18]
MNGFEYIGKNIGKIDAMALATGQPLFTDDISFPNTLHIKILYSPHAHAIIEDIDTSEAEKIPRVKLILTYKNTPQVLHTTAGQGWPEPSPYDTCMFNKKVRYVGDRVAAVAAETEEIAYEALKHIKVNYKKLPAVFDPEEAMKEGAPVIHDEEGISGVYNPKRNIVSHIEVKAGDIEKGFEESDVVVEDTFEMQYAQHCPIEPHATITYLDEYG